MSQTPLSDSLELPGSGEAKRPFEARECQVHSRNKEHWKELVFISMGAVFLAAINASLLPAMIDGDGLSHSSRAVYDGFLQGMDPKHPLAAAVLRCVYLLLEAFGLRRYTILAIAAVSNLSAVGTFWLLARVIYPAYLRSFLLSLVCRPRRGPILRCFFSRSDG